MTYRDAVDAGSRFVRLAFTMLILIQYVVLTTTDRQREVNQLVGQAVDEVRARMHDAQRRLATAERQLDRADEAEDLGGAMGPTQAGGRPTTALSPSQRLRRRPLAPAERDAIPQTARQDGERLAAVVRQLRAELTDLRKSELDLEGRRVVRQLKIPATDMAFEESDVKLLYPAALLSGLLILLFHRHRVLGAAWSPSDGAPPLWAAPIHRNRYRSTTVWLAANSAGLFLVAYVFHLVWRFSARDEFFASPYLAALSTVFAIGTAGLYLVTIAQICVSGDGDTGGPAREGV